MLFRACSLAPAVFSRAYHTLRACARSRMGTVDPRHGCACGPFGTFRTPSSQQWPEQFLWAQPLEEISGMCGLGDPPGGHPGSKAVHPGLHAVAGSALLPLLWPAGQTVEAALCRKCLGPFEKVRRVAAPLAHWWFQRARCTGATAANSLQPKAPPHKPMGLPHIAEFAAGYWHLMYLAHNSQRKSPWVA